MKKLLFLIVWMLAGVVSAQDMRTIFMDAPEELFPLLTKGLRADFVDYIDAGMTAKVTNRLDGVSVLEELDDDYLRLAMTASSTVQMKLLPFESDTVICVVNTVRAESADSRISFYNKAWKKLDGDGMFKSPQVKDFFTSPDSAYIDMCDIYLVSLMLSPVNNTLVAEYTMPSYMNIDDAKKVKPLLRKLVYRWDGECFVIE